MLTRGFRMKLDLESRIRRLEDRVSIVETVTRYCVGVDSKDWVLFASCFAPRMRTEFGEMNREEFVAIVQSALPAFRSTQHLSANHVIAFDQSNPDMATCESDMFAQHFLEGSIGGAFYLLRARYSEQMTRTPEGWRIRSIATSNRWEEGNLNAVAEAMERLRLQT